MALSNPRRSRIPASEVRAPAPSPREQQTTPRTGRLPFAAGTHDVASPPPVVGWRPGMPAATPPPDVSHAYQLLTPRPLHVSGGNTGQTPAQPTPSAAHIVPPDSVRAVSRAYTPTRSAGTPTGGPNVSGAASLPQAFGPLPGGTSQRLPLQQRRGALHPADADPLARSRTSPRTSSSLRRVGTVDLTGSLGHLHLDPIAASAAAGTARRTAQGAVARLLSKTTKAGTVIGASLHRHLTDETGDVDEQVGRTTKEIRTGISKGLAKTTRERLTRRAATGKGPFTLSGRKRAGQPVAGITSRARAFAAKPTPRGGPLPARVGTLAARIKEGATAAGQAVAHALTRAVAALGTSVGSTGLIVVAVVFAVLMALVAVLSVLSPVLADRSCGMGGAALSVQPGSIPTGPIAGYNHQQLTVAGAVMIAIQQAGGDVRDQQLAVMAAMGESSLTNPSHGDRVRNDTIGTFQIGPEHGTYEQRMNTIWSAQNFFQRLRAVPGYQSLEPSLAAHKAQRNADPYHYRPFWAPAGEVITALGGAQLTSQLSLGGGTPPGYNLGPVAPQTEALATQLGPMFGIKTIGGYRAQARDMQGHPAGLALDFMVPLNPAGRAQGDALAHYLTVNGDGLGVEYLIWYQRQYRIDRGTWTPMEDRGSPTQNHLDHVHVTLRGDATATNLATGNCPTGVGGGAVIVGDWGEPAAGGFGSPFGMRFHPVHRDWRMHQGIDMTGGGCGGVIRATHDGIVTFAGPRGGYGNMIEIDHGGTISSRYGHMFDEGVLVRAGDQVRVGQQIAVVGNAGTSTSCHLHFEIREGGTAIDPVPYLARYGLQLQSYR